MNTHAALDTSPDADAVQRRAYAAMDGFDRLEVVAQMQRRVFAMLQLRYSDPADIVLHLFRHSIPQPELNEIIEKIRARSR